MDKRYIVRLLNTFKERLHGRKIALYPYGRNGHAIRQCLKLYYGLEPSLILDNNNQCSGEKSLSFLKNLDCKEYMFLLTSSNPDIFLEVREELSKYVPGTNIFDLFPEKMQCEANSFVKDNVEESVEWLNYWIEDADIHKGYKWLLIGDSVFRQLREVLQFHVRTSIDVIATTYYGNFYRGQLDNFFHYTDYEYELAMINVDHHHFQEDFCMDSDIVLNKLSDAVASLMRVQSVVIVGGTPERSSYNNARIISRNQIAEQYALQKGYRYIDLMGTLDKKGMKHIDNVHFDRETYDKISCGIIEQLGVNDNPNPPAMLGRME